MTQRANLERPRHGSNAGAWPSLQDRWNGAKIDRRMAIGYARLTAGALAVSCFLEAHAALPAGSDTAEQAKEKADCTAAYDAAQRARAAGHFGAARGELLTCSRVTCPAMLRKDCTKWLDELDASQPTVVISATKGSAEVDDARVLIDGQPWVESLAGSAVRIDPGEHVFRFEHPPDAPIERVVLVREGEKARKIEISFGPAAAPRATFAGLGQPAAVLVRPTPVAAYAAAAVGGAGLVVFGAFAGYGLSQKSSLDACRPTCPESQVDAARASFSVADVALTAGVFSLAWAAVFYFTRPERTTPATPRVGVVPGGAVVSVGGRF